VHRRSTSARSFSLGGPRTQFDSADEFHSIRLGKGDGGIVTRQGIVVGDGEGLNSGVARLANE
jgi:hypothetical protein